ncbi:unnamed protein product, partial [Mycena citricolor]
VNVTVPKLANGTSELPSSKSSTIHSAFSPQSLPLPESDLDTLLPVDSLVMETLPEVEDFLVATRVITSPALTEKPEKSLANA